MKVVSGIYLLGSDRDYLERSARLLEHSGVERVYQGVRAEALLLNSSSNATALVLLDGDSCYDKLTMDLIRARHPKAEIAVIKGHMTSDDTAAFLKERIYRFYNKPFDTFVLSHLLDHFVLPRRDAQVMPYSPDQPQLGPSVTLH